MVLYFQTHRDYYDMSLNVIIAVWLASLCVLASTANVREHCELR